MDTGLRTSTNTLLAGIITWAATIIVGKVPSLTILLDPQVQLWVVSAIGILVARFSKTPKDPGLI